MPFLTKDSIDINQINSLILVHGDMWYDPVEYIAHSYYPKSTQKNINFTSALWMSGYDGSGQLHVASQTYRQDGNDYWPGPLDAADTITYATSAKWAKIWKVNRTDVYHFQAQAAHTATNTPAPILTWPAKGNAYATDAFGSPLSITADMAPFVDVNSNGIYEPLLGDYPDFAGDQALWWTFSDNGPNHGNSHGRPLGVEIHAMAYAYSRNTLVDNIVYYDYRILNKSTNNYNNFRIGLWDDVDLGYYYDDFIGFDSSHRMGIAYNGNSDDGGTAGHPANSYGTHIPMSGITMVVLPGDDPVTHTRPAAGSFIYYENSTSATGNPANDTEYNNYLRSKYKAGAHITNDFSSPGFPTLGYGAGPESNYVFPGDPSVNTQWSECSSGNFPGDRRFVITSNDFTLNAGSTQRVVMAQVVTPPDTGNGCPNHGFSLIKQVADTAWHTFDNPLPLLPNAVTTINTPTSIRLYPNPAHDKLYFDNPTNNKIQVTVYNGVGQTMSVTEDDAAKIIDISSLPAGAYHILITQSQSQQAFTIIKQ